MFKLVRVVLTASTRRFSSGMRRASRSFGSFHNVVTTGVAAAATAITGLSSAFFFLTQSIGTALNIAKGFFDTLLGGAIRAESMGVALEVITEDAGQAAEMIAFMREEASRTGNDFDGLAQSGQQLAVALRGANGEVDTDLWKELVKQVEAFQALRPDVPVSLWGQAISAFMAGDPSTLTRLLDVNVRQLGQLSDEARGFLDAASGASEQQLGQVTRLGGSVQAQAGDAMQALSEVAEAVGATDELVDRIAETTGGKLAQSQEELKDTLRDIGAQLLPDVNKVLGQFLELIRSDEFEEFADVFGQTLAKGLGEFVDLISQLDPEKVEAFFSAIAEALESIDFNAIANAFGQIGRTLEQVNRFLPDPQTGKTPVVEEAMENLNSTELPEGLASTGVQGFLNKAGANLFPNFGAGTATEGVGGALNQAGGALFPNQQVEVTVTVDEEGQLNVKKVAQREGKRAAEGELNTFVGGLIKD